MIIGECPYDDCEETMMLSLPDAPLPVFAPHKCEKCERTMWTKFSRVDPTSWTEEDFLKEFDVNKETKQIKPRSDSASGSESK